MKDFKLDNQPKTNSGFTFPENYFDSFSEKVMQQLPLQEPKVISLWDKNKRWVYAVAAVLVLSLSIPVMNYYSSESSETYALEVENYLTQHSTLSDDDIIELLSNEDVEALSNTSTLESNELEDILKDNANLEEYIIN
ncbi:MAG: hypothetical protein V4648_02060 [Bacteroidota bacterium]